MKKEGIKETKKKIKITKKKIETDIFNDFPINNVNITEKVEDKEEKEEVFTCDEDSSLEFKKSYDKDDFYKILNNGGIRGEFTDSTKNLYNNLYKNLINTKLFKDGVHNVPQENMIFILDNLKVNDKNVDKPSTLKSYICISLLIYRYHKKEHDKIISYAEKNKTKELLHYEEQNQKKNNILPDHRELLIGYSIISKNAEEQLNTINPLKTFYIKYIVNYLFFNFFVRSQDVHVFITNDMNEVEKRITNSKCYENTLFIDETKKYIVYRRYKYKTFKSYGVKTHIIKTNLFYNCCLKLNNSYLLQKYDGSCVSDSSINKTVQNLSIKTLGEGNIFKILIERAQSKNKPLKEIHKMFELRGSSIENLNIHYDLSKDIIDVEKDLLDIEHEQNINE